MDDAKAAWDEVGDRFATLGRHIKDRFDATVAFRDEDREQVEAALRKVADAMETGFNAIASTMRDDEIRDELKQTATAMGDALSVTFRTVADTIRK
jgi:hypothetical protein